MPIDRNNAQYITGAIYKPTQTSAPGVWDLDDQANNTAKNLWPLPPQAVQRSLRFNSADSAYLNRTPAVAGSRTTWTWSAWVKRAGLYTTNAGPTLFDVGPDNGNFMFIRFNSDTQDVIDFGWTVSGSVVCRIRSTASFRDPSAWYHIVAVLDTTNATSTDRMRLYVNGQRLTSFGVTTYPAQNTATCYVNATNIHYLGRSVEPLYRYMDGYISEVNLIDGQALDATSFGETDPQTGVWIPKRYTGTYGTNGFRLSFANNSSTTALGYDSSGQGNNWTANNFSVTPGAGNDVLLDVPSMYNTDTGLGGEVIGNYCTWNPLVTGATLANGNLDCSTSSGTWGDASGSISMKSGKWYFEATCNSITSNQAVVGVTKAFFNGTGESDTFRISYQANGTVSRDGITTSTTGLATWGVGDIVGAALDVDNGTMSFYKNGVLINTTTNAVIQTTEWRFFTRQNGSGFSANFGQRPFVYTAPAGYRALCTTNLPAPAIGQTSSNQADNHFNVVTYIGNGNSSPGQLVNVGFQPDLVWIKERNTTEWHQWYDSLRGNAALFSNTTDAENSLDGISLTSTGFYAKDTFRTNENTQSYVAWCWNAGGVSVTNNAGTNGATIASTYRANRAAGFSIVTYTGTGVGGATIAHGLGVAPKLIITKARVATGLNWAVYHASLGATKNLWLSNGDSVNTQTVVWNDTAPSSAVFTVGSAGNANSTQGVVAYCWAEIPGYSAFGSYTGNGSTDGPFVYLGFRPAFLLFKNISQAYGWQIFDSKRNPNNRVNLGLYPNVSNAEGTEAGTGPIDFLSNGFKIRDATWEEINGSTRTYIYAAFAETPARLSTAR